MIDFILFTFWALTFAGGFWCGKKYNTLGQMIDAGVTWVKGLVS